jgi:hypothetical protein
MADAVTPMYPRRLFGRALAASALFARGAAAAAEGTPRGGRVAWGRLITENSSWSVHEGNDPLLAQFIRDRTSLNIDPNCYPTDPAKLDELCRYPFIFTNNLANVTDPRRLANLREYLRRGGFIYIDRCVNLAFSLPQETFYARHLALFARFLPESEIHELPDNHEIFACYFGLDAAERTELHRHRVEVHNHLYGVFVEGRMVALLSLGNLQCGWPNSSLKQQAAMKEIANIYVYAMTRASAPMTSSP